MELLTSFKNSILLPKKEALFRLNRISMRNALVYILLLSFILVAANIMTVLGSSAGGTRAAPDSMFVLQLIVVYPFFIVFLMITGISILSALGFLLKMLFRRKLAYAYLWKITAFAITIPLFIYIVLDALEVPDSFVQVLPLIYYMIVISKVILLYPARKK